MIHDPHRLLKYEIHVRDIDRRALLIGADLLWDDLFDCALGRRVEDAQVVALLPGGFQPRASQDWRRWLVTFSTVLWKLAQPDPPRPATMAEQLLVASLVRYAEEDIAQLAADNVVELDVPEGGLQLGSWLETYLEDFDHELLCDMSLDGIR